MQGRSDSYLLELLDIGVYWAAGQVFLLLAWLMFRAIARFDAPRTWGPARTPPRGSASAAFSSRRASSCRPPSRARAATSAPSSSYASPSASAASSSSRRRGPSSALVLLPKSNLADEMDKQDNVAAGSVSALSFVSVAAIFAALVRSQLG